jgi:hypothetical protein
MAGVTGKIRRGRYFLSGPLLVANGNVDGDWQHIEGVFPMIITVSGEFVGTVTLFGETADDEPIDANANHAVLQIYTTPGQYIANGPYEWVKAEVTNYVSGVIVVSCQASESQSKY